MVSEISTKADAMAIKEYLNTNHVFNTKDFRIATQDSTTDANLLARAAANGRVKRVRQGLYVSEAERFAGIKPSPFEIAAKAVDDAVFCYLSALQLYGVLHNAVNRTQFYTRHRMLKFEFDGHEYCPHHNKDREVDSQSVVLPNGASYNATMREQTVVDCLYRLAYAGGPENALRSFSGLTYLSAGRAAALVFKTNRSTCARLGWVLDAMQDKWDIDSLTLDSLREVSGAGPHYFYSSTSPKDSHWSTKWSMYLPYPEDEMTAWLKA
jgi:predicted transcriptional regulator of viral defense system